MQLKGSGADDKKKLAIAATLGVAVILLAVHTLFGGPGATTTPVPATEIRHVETPGAPTRSTEPRGAGNGDDTEAAMHGLGQALATLDPTLHPELMAQNESYVYHGTGRNIFSRDAAPIASATMPIERVKAPIRNSAAQMATGPVGPPPPPAIDLHFFGFSLRQNGDRRAFLIHGDDVFVATQGDVVAHRYRIVQIAANSIQVEDIPYHNTQTLPLIGN